MNDSQETWISDAEVQKDFDHILNRVKGGEILVVTRHGKPTVALLPFSVYETLAIVLDENAKAAIKQGDNEITAGKTMPLEALRQ